MTLAPAAVAKLHADGSVYCPSFLLKIYAEEADQGRPGLVDITRDERQAAEAEIARDNARAAQESYLNAHRCYDSDPRPVAERDADPICIQRKQQEIAAQQEAAIEAKRKEEAARAHQQAIDRLGIREGQSQALVKAQLAADGFKMPWTCAGDWSQNVGVYPDWVWVAGCATQRTRKDSSVDSIKVFFSVYQRVRYVNTDTGEGNLVDRKTDRLILINYDGK
jgi:hypothetical protein